MSGRLGLGWALLLLPLGASGAAVGEPLRFTYRHEHVLGTSLKLSVRSQEPEAAKRAESVVLAEMDRLARIFSSYSPDSEFSRWQRTQGVAVPVSRELFEVLEQSEGWRQKSQGAFNPAVEGLTRLWQEAARQDSLPTPVALNLAVQQAARTAWRLDSAARTAEHLSDAPLSLNAIAKGYIIEQASALAWAGGGLEGLLLEIGGDLRVRGRWAESVELTDPRNEAENAAPLTRVWVRDAGLATSGNYRRGVEVRGRHYSHILDPRTGQSAEAVAGVTVIAADAATADALSTTFSVLEPGESLRMADATPGVACLLVLADGRMLPSGRWPGPEFQVTAAPEAPAEPPAKGPVTGGKEAMELAVSFEVNRVEGGRYSRPYVAAWVEDADAFPVRTILLWVLQSAKGERWIPDLRRWYRGDQTRRLAEDKDLVSTVSGATRNPGKYSVVWDGKDDHGEPVKPGKYTFYLEAAREHGTYQLMKHEFTVGSAPFTAELKGNEEIKGAALEYRRRTTRK
jgi:thiamine biosynthesis lipoprotein